MERANFGLWVRGRRRLLIGDERGIKPDPWLFRGVAARTSVIRHILRLPSNCLICAGEKPETYDWSRAHRSPPVVPGWGTQPLGLARREKERDRGRAVGQRSRVDALIISAGKSEPLTPNGINACEASGWRERSVPLQGQYLRVCTRVGMRPNPLEKLRLSAIHN